MLKCMMLKCTKIIKNLWEYKLHSHRQNTEKGWREIEETTLSLFTGNLFRFGARPYLPQKGFLNSNTNDWTRVTSLSNLLLFHKEQSNWQWQLGWPTDQRLWPQPGRKKYRLNDEHLHAVYTATTPALRENPSLFLPWGEVGRQENAHWVHI